MGNTLKRRTFLAVSSGSLLGAVGLKLRAAAAAAAGLDPKHVTLTTTICPYCAVGCGALVAVGAGRLLAVEGDPEHPINQGALCAKGLVMVQAATSPRRVTTVRYRAPGATDWQEKDWDWALAQVARRIQAAREATFRATDKQGRTVNRTEGIACLGGAALNNEECYLYAKLARALGIVYLEHQARICHSSTLAALGATFGRGAMTNHWNDLANADCILIIGSNAAENHPIAFQWVTKARERGAKLIAVDPRLTRTAAVADLYVPLRAGTDIALIGGLIHYVLEHERIHREYLVAHTNASFLVDPQFACDAGRFGPMRDGRYTREHWGFQRDVEGNIIKDPSLSDRHCVFQVLRRHFARYTLERVCEVCGTPLATLRQLAELFTATHRPDRAGTILYAMGATQHSHGTQNIRAYAILQLLLGNIGIAGGGINALRGESNVQGATDHGLLFDLLPGYLPAPAAEQASLAEYLKPYRSKASDPRSAHWRQNYPKYVLSLLKAFWGPHATVHNQFAYPWLPKHKGDCSYMVMFEAMHAGKIRGLISLGQNPAVSGPDLHRQLEALGKLQWLVVADLWETETAAFWKRPGVRPQDIATEVFFLPAADALEKEGSITNSGRWAQWRPAVVRPAGNARSDLWILDRLCRQLRQLYSAGGVFPEPIVNLAWDYGEGPEAARVAQEINGRFLADVGQVANLPETRQIGNLPHETRQIGNLPHIGGRYHKDELVPSAALLKEDGATACGNWLYCGSFTSLGNQMARRQPSDPNSDPLGLCPSWAWSWPANRRILCNRAGCDEQGRPWSVAKAATCFDWQQEKWIGDVPDGAWPPLQRPDGRPNPEGRRAFLMLPEGVAALFAPGLADGPLPEHYEPLESPVINSLSPQQASPLAKILRPEQLGNSRQYPIVATTCRVAEHWQSGAMSRNLPLLIELVPSAFVEISRELARHKGIKHGELVTVRSARGEITLPALVTARLKPLKLRDGPVEQVAIVWHFGYAGLATGPSANVLTPLVGDADSMIPEYKAFLCDVRRIKGDGEGRR